MFYTSEAQKYASGRLLMALLVIGSSLWLSRLGLQSHLPNLIFILVFFLTLSISFVRGTDGLYLVIFAMLFSPEVMTGVSTGRTHGEGSGVVIRLEDLIIVTVALGWILRSAYMGRHVGIVRTPVNFPIWVYMAASIVATLLGVMRGSVRSFPAGLMNNLKYFEYFLLYFMITAHVKDKVIVRRMIWAIFAAFFLAMVYGYTQLGSGGRVCAPFDKEPNTFGGYIVLIMCLAGGIALANPNVRIRGTMIIILLFGIPPLLFTLSRASYLAFIAALFAFLILSTHRVIIAAFASSLIACILLGFPLLPERVQERVAGTFQRESQYHVQIAGVDFDASSSARIISYQEALERWAKSPVFGYGVTGTNFIDGQYPRLLAETGIIGLATFLMIFLRLLKEVLRVFQTATDTFLKGAAMGFLCGIVAMLAHGLAANSFIIIRIAEPFWLLAGLILIIPYVSDKDGKEALAAQWQPTRPV